MNTCPSCGQSVKESETPLKQAIKNSCNTTFYDGWEAVWYKWPVGEARRVGPFTVEKVSETDSNELDGYTTIPVEMVFEVGYDEFYKVTGSWTSYDGTKWNDELIKVEKKERTAVYYG